LPNRRFFFRIRGSKAGAVSDVREIGDVDEGVVEGGEDTGNAKDELAWWDMLSANGSWCGSHARRRVAILAILTLADLGTKGDVLLRSAGGGFLGGHGDGIWRLGWWSRDRWSRRRKEEVKSKARNAARAAGRQNWKVRCRRPPRLVLALSRSFPLRMKSEHRRFSFENFIQSCKLSLLLSHPFFTQSSSHRDTAQHLATCSPASLRQLAVSCVCRARGSQSAIMDDAVVGIIGMGDMGKMYARRIANAGWR
jgi:hypothetical protein